MEDKTQYLLNKQVECSARQTSLYSSNDVPDFLVLLWLRLLPGAFLNPSLNFESSFQLRRATENLLLELFLNVWYH